MWRVAQDLAGGAVVAWALPAGRTCAITARSLLGDMLGAMDVPPEAVQDTQTMVSEVVTNVYQHARFPPEVRGAWELWAFRAGRGVVCGVFDPVPERPLPALPVRREPLAEHGRGLAILQLYSRGDWGAHPTRGQLGGHVPGKVVWFRCPAEVKLPAPVVGDGVEMARTVRDRLRLRGVEGTILTASSRMACLSVCRGLDVWCWSGRFNLREPGRSYVRAGGEIAAVVEHSVRRYEELRAG